MNYTLKQTSMLIFGFVMLNLAGLRVMAQVKTEILHWPDGKAAAVSLTFDDNVRSQLLTAIPELEKHGYRGTFFMVAQWLDLPATDEGLSEQWQGVFHRGHEIGCHSYSHGHSTLLSEKDAILQVVEAKGIIEHWIGAGNCRLFRFPWEEHSAEFEKVVQELFPLNKVNIYQDDKVIYTVPRSFAEVKQYIDQTIADNGIFIPVWHGVGGDFTKISVDDFRQVLHYLDEKRADVWIAPLGEVTRYVGLRQQATVSLEGGIHLVLPPDLDTKLINGPLSLRTTVPKDWTYVCLRRGDSSVVLPTVETTGGRAIVYQITPGEIYQVERYTPIDRTALKLTEVAACRFDSLNALKVWTVESGKAQVTDGVLRTEEETRLLLNDLSLSDFHLSGRFRMTGDQAQRVYYCWAGLFFHLRELLPAGEHNGVYYELANQPHQSDFRPNRVLLWRQIASRDGATYPWHWPDRVCASGASEQKMGDWHTFELTVLGDRLCYFVDGKLVFHVSGLDETPGQIGLNSLNSSVEFDDIMVSKVENP